MGFVRVDACTDASTEAISEDNSTQVVKGYQYNYTGLHFSIVTILVCKLQLYGIFHYQCLLHRKSHL